MFGIAFKCIQFTVKLYFLSRPMRSNIAKGVVVATGHKVQISQCDIM